MQFNLNREREIERKLNEKGKRLDKLGGKYCIRVYRTNAIIQTGLTLEQVEHYITHGNTNVYHNPMRGAWYSQSVADHNRACSENREAYEQQMMNAAYQWNAAHPVYVPPKPSNPNNFDDIYVTPTPAQSNPNNFDDIFS